MFLTIVGLCFYAALSCLNNSDAKPSKLKSHSNSIALVDFPGFFVSDIFVRFENIVSPTDCILLCYKMFERCASTSYVILGPDRKMCLLSGAEGQSFEIVQMEAIPSVYYTILDQATVSPFTPRSSKIPHGPAPKSCGSPRFAQHQPSASGPNERLVFKRILGGFTSHPYAAPWVGILTLDRKARCSASIIAASDTDKSTLWALTSAHCIHIEGDSEERVIDSRSIKRFGICFGVHDARFTTPHLVFRQLAKIYPVPDDGPHLQDVAIVKLEKSLQINSYVSPLCLPNEAYENEDGRIVWLQLPSGCINCGFGANTLQKSEHQSLDSADKLTCIEVPYQPKQSEYPVPVTPLERITWPDKEPKGPYHGDSGSPVGCRNQTSGKYYAYGIIAGGVKATGISYALMAKIQHYMDWIKAVLVCGRHSIEETVACWSIFAFP